MTIIDEGRPFEHLSSEVVADLLSQLLKELVRRLQTTLGVQPAPPDLNVSMWIDVLSRLSEALAVNKVNFKAFAVSLNSKDSDVTL